MRDAREGQAMSDVLSAKCQALCVAMKAVRRYAGAQQDPARRHGAEQIIEDLTIHHLILTSQPEVPDHASPETSRVNRFPT
jgi:hypothetical protein